ADYLQELRALGGKAARQAPASVLARPQPAAMTAMPAQAPAPTMMDQPAAGRPQNPQIAALPETVQQFIRKASRDYYLTSVAARTDAALSTPPPSVERHGHFCANHR